MPDGILNLSLADVYGSTLREPADIFLRHQTLSDDRALRGVKPSKTIAIRNLNQAPQGLYRLEVDAPSYRAVSRFVNVPASGAATLTVVLPVDKNRIVSVNFPPAGSLPDEARRLLAASGDPYQNWDDLRKAGFLNLSAKALHTRLPDGRSVLSYLNRITEERGDRLFAMAAPALHAEVQHAVTAGLFHAVSDQLHQPAPGFHLVDSYKTYDHYGNLQLTFSSNGKDWNVDMDIDDAQGFEHIFQVVRNSVTGQPTHPYDIHEILLEFQELDPGYSFNLQEETTVGAARGGQV